MGQNISKPKGISLFGDWGQKEGLNEVLHRWRFGSFSPLSNKVFGVPGLFDTLSHLVSFWGDGFDTVLQQILRVSGGLGGLLGLVVVGLGL